MNASILNSTLSADFYRGSEVPTVHLESPNAADNAPAPQVYPTVGGKKPQEEVMSKEREEKIELWMHDIKAFIRNIDVSNL